MSEPPPLFQPSPIEPLRVEAIPYQSPMTGPIRPGIIVAVGVISIVVGSLSILFSCGGIFTGSRRTITRMVMTPTTVPSGNGPGNSLSVDGPAVMTEEHREIAIRGMDHSGNLSPMRRAMLDRLLAQAGDKMFPFDESKITEDMVAASVAQSGQVPGPAGAADAYFILANGRIEVGDDHASFSSNSRDEPTVYVYSPSTAQSAAGPSNQNTIMTPTFTTSQPKSITPYNAYAVISIFELLLAIYLLVIGILALRGSMRARRFHLLYALLKFPTIAVASWAYYVIFFEQMSGFALGGASSPGMASGMAIGMTVFQTIPACLYPIALLIVMNIRPVKDYYGIST